MFKCPNCNEMTISKSSKFWIGPARSIRCSNCHAKVSVPYLSMFTFTLYMLLNLVIMKTNVQYAFVLLYLILSGIIFMYLFYKLVPLKVKVRAGETKTTKYHIKNSIIAIIYFVTIMGIMMFILN